MHAKKETGPDSSRLYLVSVQYTYHPFIHIHKSALTIVHRLSKAREVRLPNMWITIVRPVVGTGERTQDPLQNSPKCESVEVVKQIAEQTLPICYTGIT